MARVPNKDGQGIIANGYYGVVDPSYDAPTAFAAGVPTTVGYAGEMRVDNATGSVYRFLGPLGANWAETNIR
jgi:hypothetical protein